MTRVFLKLYLLLILPLILMTMLPQSPLSMLGEWWLEKEAFRQYGAIYPLVKEELDLVPQSKWVQKVESLADHFAYRLQLKRNNDLKLSLKAQEKLEQKDYALIKYKDDNTLVFKVADTDFALLASLYSHVSEMETYEKDTRGFRYFLNKKVKESSDPIAEFERIKPFFNMEVKLILFSDFIKNNHNKETIEALEKNKLFIDRSAGVYHSYILSDNNKYLVEITGTNARATYRKYYNYLSFIVPAILLAIGALIWMFLFQKEFRKVNNAAKTLGDGKFDTRIELSKNSALYPIAGSFNNMATRIEALLEGHKDLTNAVSHELKTPLSRLHFALEMQKNSSTPEERKLYTDKIENNIVALENLVNELLSYTRLQREQSIKTQKHPFNQWLKKEVRTFCEYNPNIEVRVEADIDKDINFDRHLMSRALNNLLENAATHAKTNQPMIKIKAKLDANIAYLTIDDNGQGIDTTYHETIFDPFTRLDKSRKRKNDKSLGGFGMGLAIVKSILKQHKGSVSCKKSALGGASFQLQWPI